jgi:SAM-dependent methyltransferase
VGKRALTRSLAPVLRSRAGTWTVRAAVRAWMSAVEQDAPAVAARRLVGLMDDVYRRVDVFAAGYDDGVHVKHRLTGYHAFFLANVHRGERVLDVGCGKGELACDLATRCGAEVVAIDVNARSLAFAREHRPDPRVTYLEQDVFRYEPDGEFDVIVLSNVLEHLTSRPELLRRLVTTTRASRVLIRVPVLSRDWLVPFRQELGLPHFSDPTHELEYEPETLADELAAAGLEIASLERRWGELRVAAVPVR